MAARITELYLSAASPERDLGGICYPNLGKTDEDDIDDEGEDDGSSLYKDRISRTNVTWDTIDPRLASSLVEMLPALKDRMVWEPAAGCGMLLDQLESQGNQAGFAATDIEPRRDDIPPARSA